MTGTDEARRMLHEGADAVWPHGGWVKDCWLCKCIGIIETEARAPFVTVQSFDLLPGETVAVEPERCAGYDLSDRPDLAPNIVCTLPAGHGGFHIWPAEERCSTCGNERGMTIALHADPGLASFHPFTTAAPEAEPDQMRTAPPQSMTYAEVTRMLRGIRRSIEVMGEDGECSLRTIRGVQYVTKDDAMAEVDERLGFVLFLTDSAA